MTTQFPSFVPSTVSESWFNLSVKQDPEEEINKLEKEFEETMEKIISKDKFNPIVGENKIITPYGFESFYSPEFNDLFQDSPTFSEDNRLVIDEEGGPPVVEIIPESDEDVDGAITVTDTDGSTFRYRHLDVIQDSD